MNIEFPDKFNLADYFLYQRLEEGLGNKAAVLYGDRAYTYSDVSQRAVSLANYLQKIGLQAGQRVYIVLPDTAPYVWSVFATWTAGGVLTMGNPMASVDELLYVMDYTDTTALITLPEVAESLAPQLLQNCSLKTLLLVVHTATGQDPEIETPIPASLANAPFEVLSLTDAIALGATTKSPQRPVVHRDDSACWLFTSGSTGRPKAAMHAHRDFAFNTEVYAKRTVAYRKDDITLSVPRLFFGYATGTNLFFPFAVGATTALFSELPNPQSIASAVKKYRPTIITNVPTMLGKLLNEKPDLDFSSVRFQLSAGEALPPTLLEKFLSHFGTDIYDGIGSAEMFHIYCSNRPGDIKPGSLGRVVPGYALKVLPADAEGVGAKETAPGETGVLWVKGDSVAYGYHRDRDKSWQTFYGHWCRTGDLFSKDEQGYLWFRGRADDLFKVNGRWMAPQEVEECLLQHEAVAACVVIPVEVEGLSKPKALVVLKEVVLKEVVLKNTNKFSANQESLVKVLQQHVLSRIAKHKYPRTIEFISELPKNDRGKIDRKQLIAREKDN